MPNAVRYLVFDTESVADAALVAKLRYAAEGLSPGEAVRRYRDELMEKYESDFIPYSFQVPISVVVGKVTAEFRLEDVVVLDEPQFRPHVITENFWRGWEKYRRPTLVSFNGRGFDLPLLELAAFRYGVSVPGWFQSHRQVVRSAPQPLQHHGPHRPVRTADQLRLDPLHRRAEPGGEHPRQARQNGRPRRHGPGHVRRRPAGRNQRLLPLRRVGHLLRVPSHPGAAGPTRRWTPSSS